MNRLTVKNYLMGLGLVLVGPYVMAQTATISYSGTIRAATCSITASAATGSTTASTGYTVSLPAVGTGSGNGNGLGVTGGTAGRTPFYLGVTGCGSGTALSPSITFQSASNGRTDNSLIPTQGPTNLVIDVLDKDATKISLVTNTTLASFTWPASGASSYYDSLFYLQYRANTGAVTGSGVVSGSFVVQLAY